MRIKYLIRDHKLLIIILFVTAFLRIWKLGEIPPHLTPDEAALGYNAYSILKTGRDEYGQFLPIIFKSFGDYKPGFYVYLTVPFVIVFGLTEFTVRLPSALAGVIAVFLIYKIVRSFVTNNKSLAILSAALLAISPWHIHFSRGAWEVNVSLTLTLAGIYFFLKSLEKQKNLIYSAIFFALTLLTYQGAKLSTGIVLVILIILFWKEIVKFNKKHLFLGLLIGILVSSPIFLSFFQGKTGRLNVFSVFSYRRPDEYLLNQLSRGNEKVGDLGYYLFHTEVFNIFRGIMGRYFNHFSGRFLFFEGDWQNPRHSIPNHGMLLFIDFVPIMLGIVALVKSKNPKLNLFILVWLALSPMPSVLSRDQVHAVRSLNMIIPLTILMSLGIIDLYKSIDTNISLKTAAYFLLSIAYLLNYIYFLDAYFIHLPRHDSRYWEYGYKQIVETVSSIQYKYENIKIRQSFAQPYIYFLFYQRYDPSKYQKQAKLVQSEYKNDVGYIEKLDNICFCPIDWSINRGESGTLFVADPIRIPPEDSSNPNEFNLIKEIKYLNEEIAFRILEVK